MVCPGAERCPGYACGDLPHRIITFSWRCTFMTSTPIPVATLKATGGVPEVEIVVGHLHRADYQLLLFDTHGANPVGVGSRTARERPATRFPIDFRWSFPSPICIAERSSGRRGSCRSFPTAIRSPSP